jgi:hypothetical protein
MTNFEFVFSLFGLLLGLGLAEVLGGFGTAIQHRRKVRIGWLTPLLGCLVALDLTSFWMVAWNVRELVPAHYLSLLGGLVIIGLYYFVARISFPDDPDDWPDYDAYYFEHRRLVVGGILIVNLLAIAALTLLGNWPLHSLISRLSLAVFIPALVAVMFVKDKRINVVLLVLLVVQYPVVPTLNLLGAGI